MRPLLNTILILFLLVETSYAADYTEPITGMEFVFVKGGCFKMGDIFEAGRADEKPIHQVCVDDFFIGKYEVTQGQYQKIIGTNPTEDKRKRLNLNNPVVQVSWKDAQIFADRIARQSSKNFRLPSEAEWEYAARSGGKNEQWAGTSGPNKPENSYLSDYACFHYNCYDGPFEGGYRKSNGLGIYDMSGNVWEWCIDWYDEGYYAKSPQKNPMGPPSGTIRVLRGGSYLASGEAIRTTVRYGYTPSGRGSDFGIRLVLPAVR